MTKALKKSHREFLGWPATVINAALKPNLLFSGMRYRLHGLRTKAVSALPLGAYEILYPQGHSQFKEMSFTFAAIALSARVACADGKLTREKYIAFRESFPLSGEVCGKIRSLFILACRNETPCELYVAQIKYMFPGRPDPLITLAERLFRIATAGGKLSRATESVLSGIAYQLGISASDYSEMVSYYTHSLSEKKQAQHVLGVDKGSDSATVKKRYRELMRSYHPDRFAGHTLSEEVEVLLQLKSSEINAAYRALRAG